MRRGESDGEISKEFNQGSMASPMQSGGGTIFTAQPTTTQAAATNYTAQAQTTYEPQPVVSEPVYQQPLPVQPAVVEPQVLQQWTDENGHTWRQMDNGTMLWWNGTDWQPAA